MYAMACGGNDSSATNKKFFLQERVTMHTRDCAYVTNDGPAPCTCGGTERDANKALIRAWKAVGCGSCKATGFECKWDASGNLVPTDKICGMCNGTAIVGTIGRAH
jgi:hypothetical protein